MKIGLVCNDIATEEAGYTTTRLGLSALEMGHEPWLIGVGDFANDPDDSVRAWARAVPRKTYRTTATYLADLQGPKARIERIAVDDLDVLLLRNDPAADLGARPWAQSAGYIFGQRATTRGVIVLNDPEALAASINKLYFESFPRVVRPRSLISRNADDLRKFVEDEGGRACLKPLQGSGGTNVFVVKPTAKGNLNQIIEAVTRDGYAIAQEFLPDAKHGDTRFFLMNGQPLVVGGKYCAFRRISAKNDVRSNLHAGGKLAKAVITDEMLQIAEIVRPKLIADGMFLVGLDIVGTKLMEINVFSPGGLGSAAKFEKVDFSHAVIAALERKVAARQHAGRSFTNRQLAMI
ncbi:MAG: glutathione synthase [Deltaproteobacteria bacterium]|nr:glutathione synthase [Deltaproteobacteria bacterium]MDQ3297928.1 glutathione synthetase [Myxococcota bacterium]